MKNPTIVFILVFLLRIESTNVTSGGTTIINSQQFNTKYLQLSFVKFQQASEITIAPNNNFQYVANLDQSFSVTRNTLFKIQFQGSVSYRGERGVHIYLQIIVNDHILIGNRALKNTAERINYGLGGSFHEVDYKQGWYWVATTSSPTAVPITRLAQIYLSPGVYAFNVGARTDVTSNTNGVLIGGTVVYELTQFDGAQSTSFGDFPLVTNLTR